MTDQTVRKNHLSASPVGGLGIPTGKPIKVTATASLGTVIHSTTLDPFDSDEIWMWARNIDSSQRTLTLEWGTVGVDFRKDFVLAANTEELLLIPGFILLGLHTVFGFATAADKIFITGYVHTIAEP